MNIIPLSFPLYATFVPMGPLDSESHWLRLLLAIKKVLSQYQIEAAIFQTTFEFGFL